VYRAAEYSTYPQVPKIKADFRPKRLARMLPVMHVNVINAKRIALPALILESVLSSASIDLKLT
jgi:hypothetical protein